MNTTPQNGMKSFAMALFIMLTLGFMLPSAGAQNLATWRTQNFGHSFDTGSAMNTADPDKDGMNNLMEYALNRDPNKSTPASWGVTKIEGSNLTLTYVRRKAALNEMAFVVLWSANVNGPWSNSGVTEQILSDNGTLQTAKAQVALSGATRKYLKIGVNYSSGVVSKTFMTTHTSSAVWSDGKTYHPGRVNMPNNPLPPAGVSVTNIQHLKTIIDFWASQGGTHISFPLGWDDTETSPGVFEFRKYDWILNYATSKGIKCNIYLWPVLTDSAAGITYASTVNWKYETSDITQDYYGKKYSQQFMHFHSPRLSNYYRWLHGVAAHLAPFWNNNQLGYVALATSSTKELQYMGGDNSVQDGFLPAEISAYNKWHLARYGTAAAYPQEYVNSGTDGQRYYRFRHEAMSNFAATSHTILKQYAPFRCVWDAGSFTDGQSTRGVWAALAGGSLSDGYKHNPGLVYDAAFDTRAVMAPTGWATVEWTNEKHAIPDDNQRRTMLTNSVRTSIDLGASDISFAFFDPVNTADAVAVVNSLKSTGHWTKQIALPLNTTSPDLVISVKNVLLNGWGVAGTTPFNVVKNNGGGASNIRVINDLP